MPAAPQTQTQDIVLGAGYVYFEENDANGALGSGRRYVGDSPGLTITGSPEKLDVYDSDDPVAEKLLSMTTKVDRSGTLTLRDDSGENRAAFLMGAVQTVTQTATPVADEAHSAVQQGRYYQLGRSITNPSGVKGIGSVSVTGSGGTPTYTVTTDYVVYADEGMIYIVPGGTIADDTNIEVDYTPDANSREQVVSSGDGAQRGEMTYVENNTRGNNKVWTFPLVEIAPNGEAALKSRDQVREYQFTVSLETRTGYEQAYCDGVPA